MFPRVTYQQSQAGGTSPANVATQQNSYIRQLTPDQNATIRAIDDPEAFIRHHNLVRVDPIEGTFAETLAHLIVANPLVDRSVLLELAYARHNKGAPSASAASTIYQGANKFFVTGATGADRRKIVSKIQQCDGDFVSLKALLWAAFQRDESKRGLRSEFVSRQLVAAAKSALEKKGSADIPANYRNLTEEEIVQNLAEDADHARAIMTMPPEFIALLSDWTKKADTERALLGAPGPTSSAISHDLSTRFVPESGGHHNLGADGLTRSRTPPTSEDDYQFVKRTRVAPTDSTQDVPGQKDSSDWPQQFFVSTAQPPLTPLVVNILGRFPTASPVPTAAEDESDMSGWLGAQLAQLGDSSQQSTDQAEVSYSGVQSPDDFVGIQRLAADFSSVIDKGAPAASAAFPMNPAGLPVEVATLASSSPGSPARELFEALDADDLGIVIENRQDLLFSSDFQRFLDEMDPQILPPSGSLDGYAVPTIAGLSSPPGKTIVSNPNAPSMQMINNAMMFPNQVAQGPQGPGIHATQPFGLPLQRQTEIDVWNGETLLQPQPST